MKFLAALSILLVLPLCQASDFLKLAERVPRGGNAVMAVDVQSILSSELAKSKGWDRKIQEGGFDRPLHFPPEASKFMTVSQIDVVRGFQTRWNVGVFDLEAAVPLKLVARLEGGYVDAVDGIEAVWIPSDAYVISGMENVLCMQSPADRQAIVRWAKAMKPTVNVGLTDYLTKAVAKAGKGPQVVLAVDLKNALQPHRVRESLKASGFAEQHSVDAGALEQLIESVQGVSVEVTLAAGATAVTRIDFDQEVSLNEATLRALIEAALDSNQMSLPELKKHKLTTVGKSILLEGDVDASLLRRLTSTMAPASTKFSSLQGESTEASSGDDMARNSVAYFQSVQSLVEDLKSKSKSSASDSYWIDRYATMIDKLPILHVDEELLVYGQQLTETLRQMSGTRKQARMQGGAAARNSITSGGYDSGYGYNNYNYPSTGDRRVSAMNARATAAASGSLAKVQGFTLIDNATNEMRRKMTQKYGVEF